MTPLPDLSTVRADRIRLRYLRALVGGKAFTQEIPQYVLPHGCPDRMLAEVVEHRGRDIDIRLPDGRIFTLNWWNVDAGCTLSIPGHPGQWAEWTPEGRALLQHIYRWIDAQPHHDYTWTTLEALRWQITRDWDAGRD